LISKRKRKKTGDKKKKSLLLAKGGTGGEVSACIGEEHHGELEEKSWDRKKGERSKR